MGRHLWPDPVNGLSDFERRAADAGISSDQFPSRYKIGSVLDEVSARPERMKDLGAQRVRNLLAHAEHFLLDEDAGRRVVDMVESNAPLIRDMRQFAIMPFPVMTISLPTRVTHDADRETLLMVEERNGHKVFALALRNRETGGIVSIPGWYAYAEEHGKNSRLVFRTDGPPMPDDEMLRRQIGTYSLALDAVLLFLNQKRGVHFTEPTMKRKSLLRGRPVTYFARRTITLAIDAPAVLQLHHATATREACRRHAVRGHFFHRGGDIHCTHRWAALDGHADAWECVDCERRRFWRRDFERGDINKGVVSSRYSIKGGNS
jgi:hypothetical protein